MTVHLEPAELDELRALLVEQAETIAVALLGEPVAKTSREWRFGSRNGSLGLVIAGRKRGLWRDRADDRHGDMFGMIQQMSPASSFSAAIDWAIGQTGYQPRSIAEAMTPEQRRARAKQIEEDRAQLAVIRAEREAKAQAARMEEDAAAIAWAGRIAAGTVPLAGTPGHVYLTATRLVPDSPHGFGTDIGWNAAQGGVVAIARDPAGLITAVQTIRTTSKGEKRVGADGLRKKTAGRLQPPGGQASVYVPGHPGARTDVLVHAEGIETLLSACAVTGLPGRAWLGGLINATMQPGCLNLVLRDDDPPDNKAAYALDVALAGLHADGVDILPLYPHADRRGDKSDFNDLLREAGPGAVSALVNAALPPAPPPPDEASRSRLEKRGAARSATLRPASIITPRPESPPAPQPEPPPAAREKVPTTRHLAGEIELARRPPVTSLPPYYPAATENRDAALARQQRVIVGTIAEGARIAAARREVEHRRAVEIAAMGLDGLELSPSDKAAITKRHIRDVSGEFGFGKRLPLPPRVHVSGSQGSGKTRVALEAVSDIGLVPGSDAERAVVWFTAPTLEKAEENYRDYLALSSDKPDALPAYVVRGRSAPDKERPGHSMCDRARAAQTVATAGLAPRKVLCPACPFRETCGTLRQEADIRDMNGGAFFLANSYLFLPCPAPAPGVLVADERVDGIAAHVTEVDTAALDPFLIDRLDVDSRDSLGLIRSILCSGRPILLELRTHRIDQEELSKIIGKLDGLLEQAAPDISGTMEDDAIEQALDLPARRTLMDALIVLRALLREIDMPRDSITGVVVHGRQTITVSNLAKPHGLKHAAVLALDGTGGDPGTLALDAIEGVDHGVLTATPPARLIFGPTLRFERIAIERTATVTGTIGKRYSRQSATGVDAFKRPIESKATGSKKLRHEIGLIAEAMPGTAAVFASKSVTESLVEGGHLAPDSPTGHFNNLRGMNQWENCRSALVYGQISMGIYELEAVARCYMLTDPVPFISAAAGLSPDDAAWEAKQWPYWVTRMRRMADGSKSPVNVPVHPDPRVQRVYEQIREAEAVQAPDRVRPIFNQRDIVLMNNLVVDVTYHAIQTHKELVAGGNPLERCLNETGFLSLNAEDLHQAHPDRFPSVRAARRALENYPPPSKNTPLCDAGVVSYRTPGQRGLPSRAIVDRVWYPDMLAGLRRFLGEITEFQGVRLDQDAPVSSKTGHRPVYTWGGMPVTGVWSGAAPHARPPLHAPP